MQLQTAGHDNVFGQAVVSHASAARRGTIDSKSFDSGYRAIAPQTIRQLLIRPEVHLSSVLLLITAFGITELYWRTRRCSRTTCAQSSASLSTPSIVTTSGIPRRSLLAMVAWERRPDPQLGYRARRFMKNANATTSNGQVGKPRKRWPGSRHQESSQ